MQALILEHHHHYHHLKNKSLRVWIYNYRLLFYSYLRSDIEFFLNYFNEIIDRDGKKIFSKIMIISECLKLKLI